MTDQPTATHYDSAFVKAAVLRISAIEFWERYSFYNMFSLLSLFVAMPVMKGGMGWSEGQALRFFGVYLLSVQLAPLVGGFLIDRWISARVALRIGALGLVIGHSLLAVSAVLPHVQGGALAQWAGAHGLALGQSDGGVALPAALSTRYFLTSIAFYGAVAFVAFGNGLFKPILTSVVGRLPHASAVDRETAFTTFFLFINIGGLMSTLLGGLLAQSLGWGWAFGAAATGMIIALVTMTVFSRRYIAPFLHTAAPPKPAAGDDRPAAPSSLVPLLALYLIIILLSMASYQSYGFVSLFTNRLVDRNVAGFTIPPAWFTALNPITIMVLTPVLLKAWAARRWSHDWSASGKLAGSMVLVAFAFGALVIASLQTRGGGLANPFWVFLAIAVIAASELLSAPSTMSAVTRLVVPQRQAFALGGYGAAVGVGAWLSGRLGALALESDTALVLGIVGLTSLAFAFTVFLLRRRLARLGI